ncbi:MAG: hypothetical protein ABR601_09460, partial [Parasphingopyxis sp.]
LYSTATWNIQSHETTQLSVSVSDGQNVTDSTVTINWQPDPMGGPLLPIVLDLDGDGLELVEADASGIEWDVDQDGYLDQLGWVGADDGFLVFDRDGSGTVNSLSELSFVGDLEGAQTDLEGLVAFDSDHDDNSDGVLDANDVWFNEFYIWRDANQNGISDAGEMVRLADSGITAINLAGTPTGEEIGDTDTNVVLNLGNYADGSSGGIFGDVGLGVIFGGAQGSQMQGLGLSHGKSSGNGGQRHANKKDIDTLLKGKQTGGDSGALTGVSSGTASGGLTPIILDLDRNGLNLVPIGLSPVLFDADDDGRKEWTGWFAPGDAVLAIDLDGDGAISSGAEIRFTQYLPGAKTDLEGLAGLDSDGSGVIDAGDARFGDLLLWQDHNMDGVSQKHELTGLDQAEISAIRLDGQAVNGKDGGNVVHQSAIYQRADGSTGIVGDAELGFIELTDDQIAQITGQEGEDKMDWKVPFAENYNGLGVLSIEEMLALDKDFGAQPKDQSPVDAAADQPDRDNGTNAGFALSPTDIGYATMRHQLIEALAFAPGDAMGMAQISEEQRFNPRPDFAMVARHFN